MNREQFINYMQSPEKLNGESVAQLAEVVEQFPYCQTAHLLYLKNLHLQKSIHYNNRLKITAVYSSDRKKMYELVIKPALIAKIEQIEEMTAATDADKKGKDLSLLEKQILQEAVNATIQLEVAKKVSEEEKSNIPPLKTPKKQVSKPKQKQKINNSASILSKPIRFAFFFI